MGQGVCEIWDPGNVKNAHHFAFAHEIHSSNLVVDAKATLLLSLFQHIPPLFKRMWTPCDIAIRLFPNPPGISCSGLCTLV